MYAQVRLENIKLQNKIQKQEALIKQKVSTPPHTTSTLQHSHCFEGMPPRTHRSSLLRGYT